jgi:hypothetical protein
MDTDQDLTSHDREFRFVVEPGPLIWVSTLGAERRVSFGPTALDRFAYARDDDRSST